MLRSYDASRFMNAEKYDLDRIYFGGCFIRGKSIISTASTSEEGTIDYQATLQPLRPFHMLFAFGATEPSEHFSSATKASCA